MASGFSDQCSVAVSNTYNTTGTLTRASINVLTPTNIRDLFGPDSKWAELDAVLKHQIEMQACGVRRSALYDWIMSSNKQGQGRLIGVQKVAKGPSMINPFILGKQQSIINADHWYITANVAEGSYVGGNLAAATTTGSRVITVKSSFGSSLPPSAGYFLPKKYLYVISASGGAFRLTQFKIVQAGVNGSDAVDIEVALSQASSGVITSASTTTSGIVVAGPNNIADVEAWCHDMLNTNGTKLVPFWYQTRRWQRGVDSEYKKLFEKLMANNAWYAMFQDLPMSERNRQDEVRDQKEFLNAFFYGTPISNDQSLTGWGSLEQITSVTGATVDPGTGGKLIAYRANMIGVLPQLNSCGQFADTAGAALEIKTFLETDIYDIWRARSSRGRPANEIDIYTDQGSADEFMQAFIGYSKEKLGDIVRLNIDDGTTSLGFPFRRFKLYKPHGVYVNVITDNYFDDNVSAFGAAAPAPANSSLGKFLYVLDLGSGGTIYPAILGSNRKQYKVGQIEDLAKVDTTFSCVMENPTIERTLTSTTATVVVECPLNSKVVGNFSGIQHTPA